MIIGRLLCIIHCKKLLNFQFYFDGSLYMGLSVEAAVQSAALYNCQINLIMSIISVMQLQLLLRPCEAIEPDLTRPEERGDRVLQGSKLENKSL